MGRGGQAHCARRLSGFQRAKSSSRPPVHATHSRVALRYESRYGHCCRREGGPGGRVLAGGDRRHNTCRSLGADGASPACLTSRTRASSRRSRSGGRNLRRRTPREASEIRLKLALIVRVKLRAERQIDAAAAWWSKNRPTAPGAIRSDLKAAFDALIQQPGIGTPVENARDPETRRLYLARTRYFVYYRKRGKYLEIVAFWHSSREHGPSV